MNLNMGCLSAQCHGCSRPGIGWFALDSTLDAKDLLDILVLLLASALPKFPAKICKGMTMANKHMATSNDTGKGKTYFFCDI